VSYEEAFDGGFLDGSESVVRKTLKAFDQKRAVAYHAKPQQVLKTSHLSGCSKL
jgi:hypothetical protein